MSGCRLLFVFQILRPIQIKNNRQLTQVLQASYCPALVIVLAIDHSSISRTRLGPSITTTWNQGWVNVGPPSVMLAQIQRGVKHDTVTQ